MHMKPAATNLDGIAARFDTCDRPGAGSEPEVLDHITQLFVALRNQFA